MPADLSLVSAAVTHWLTLRSIMVTVYWAIAVDPVILGRVPRQLTVVRPHLQSMIDRRIKTMYNFITT